MLPCAGKHPLNGEPLASTRGISMQLWALAQSRVWLQRSTHWPSAQVFDDEIGVTPSVSPKFPNISIPYGCLVPAQLDGLLACGRHIACDPNSHGFMREIPQCWITGQAAGIGAALAAARGLEPRAVSIDELQASHAKQGVYLRPRAAAVQAAKAGR